MSDTPDLKAILDDLSSSRPTWNDRSVVITSARLEHTGSRSHVWGQDEHGTEQVLISFYPDELTFAATEFVGRTVADAHDLFRKRDVEYLQS